MINDSPILKNVVTFLGDESSVRQIRKMLWREIDGVHDIVFDPSSVCPIPEEAMKHGELDKFCKENWGCSSVFMNDREISLNCISFETEEHPPRKIFKRIFEMYPDISILVEFARYDGKGFDNAGQILYRNGKAIDGIMLPSYSKILLEQVQGDKFSVLNSRILHPEKEEKSDLKPLLSKLMTQELETLQKVYNILKVSCDDDKVASSSAIVRQIEKNYNALQKLSQLYENSLLHDVDLTVSVNKQPAKQEVSEKEKQSSNDNYFNMFKTTPLEDWKKGTKENDSVSAKPVNKKSGSYIPQRSVLTKPKYRSISPKGKNKENNTKKNNSTDYEK